MIEKNTPRDFFLHAGAFITLYLGAIALITLIFSVINYVYPDPLFGPSDPYSGPMRFAIASLIILTPMTVYLFKLIQSGARANPERTLLGVRKWLTYITLFVAGATIIGDLIILLDSFLGGTLPTAFVLKIIAILAIMGGGFAYFFFDIRGYWLDHKTNSQYVGGGLLLFVLACIVGGMGFVGSPATQRAYRVDITEVQDLTYISQTVLSYWQQTKTLPPSLSALNNDLAGIRMPNPPKNQPAYEYEATGDLSFKICATFLGDSAQRGTPMALSTGFVEPPQWNHKAGYTCFTRTIDPKLTPSKNDLMTVPISPPEAKPVIVPTKQ